MGTLVILVDDPKNFFAYLPTIVSVYLRNQAIFVFKNPTFMQQQDDSDYALMRWRRFQNRLRNRLRNLSERHSNLIRLNNRDLASSVNRVCIVIIIILYININLF